MNGCVLLALQCPVRWALQSRGCSAMQGQEGKGNVVAATQGQGYY